MHSPEHFLFFATCALTSTLSFFLAILRCGCGCWVRVQNPWVWVCVFTASGYTVDGHMISRSWSGIHQVFDGHMMFIVCRVTVIDQTRFSVRIWSTSIWPIRYDLSFWEGVNASSNLVNDRHVSGRVVGRMLAVHASSLSTCPHYPSYRVMQRSTWFRTQILCITSSLLGSDHLHISSCEAMPSEVAYSRPLPFDMVVYPRDGPTKQLRDPLRRQINQVMQITIVHLLD